MSLIEVYLATEKNHLAQTALMNVQENSHMVMQILTSAIRTAGYVGCAKLMTIDNKIEKYSGEEIKAGSDAMTINKVSVEHATLSKKMTDFTNLYVRGRPNFKEEDILFISNCKSAEIFKVKHVTQEGDEVQKIISEKHLSQKYDQYTEVSRIEKNTYFIGKTARFDENGSVVFALYEMSNNANKTELVEGVNDMKINFVVLEKN
jgi:hypothetical protein